MEQKDLRLSILRMASSNAQFNDIKIIGPDRVYTTNKFVLCSWSQWFRRHFSEHNEKELTLPYDIGNCFHIVFDMFHSSVLKISPNNIIDIIKIGYFYEIESIISELPPMIYKETITITQFLIVKRMVQYDLYDLLNPLVGVVSQVLVDLYFDSDSQYTVFLNDVFDTIHKPAFLVVIFKFIIKEKVTSHGERPRSLKIADMLNIVDQFCQVNSVSSESEMDILTSFFDWDSKECVEYFDSHDNIPWMSSKIARKLYSESISNRSITIKAYSELVKKYSSFSRWHVMSWFNSIESNKAVTTAQKIDLLSFVATLGNKVSGLNPENYNFIKVFTKGNVLTPYRYHNTSHSKDYFCAVTTTDALPSITFELQDDFLFSPEEISVATVISHPILDHPWVKLLNKHEFNTNFPKTKRLMDSISISVSLSIDEIDSINISSKISENQSEFTANLTNPFSCIRFSPRNERIVNSFKLLPVKIIGEFIPE